MLSEVELPVEGGTLILSDPQFAPQGEARLFRLQARVPGIEFSAIAETQGDGYSLCQFFGDLADAWSGWDGERHWYDDAVRLRVSATHDGRRAVTFNFQYRSDPR